MRYTILSEYHKQITFKNKFINIMLYIIINIRYRTYIMKHVYICEYYSNKL